VPTLRCSDEDSRHFVLSNLERLVVKPANESGGYGVLVGPQATEDELAGVTKQIENAPNRWVAQPVISLSTAPTLCDRQIAPRHVDLRPFTLLGPEGAYVTRGGLTRVARQEGSLVVNSSQGGGSKDTWVVGTRSSAPSPAASPSRARRGGPTGPPQEAETGDSIDSGDSGEGAVGDPVETGAR
jgi:uncharacterized circularly permuted ATP-grasp superfamily protein